MRKTILLGIPVLFVCSALPIWAQSTCVVDRLTDTGEGSELTGDLRYCITQASSGLDTITFAVTGTINLTGALPALAASVTIAGPGADKLTVRRDTGGDYRIFTLTGAPTVVISGLTLTNGLATGTSSDGGAILNSGGSLFLSQVVVSNNQAVGIAGRPGRGGGVANLANGTLTVADSVFSQNQAVGGSDARGVGGGIGNLSSHMALTRSSFIENEARGGESQMGFGGGVYQADPSGTPVGTISGCTFIGNRAIGGDNGVVAGDQQFETRSGGLGGGVGNSRGMLNVENSVFTANLAQGGNGAVAAPTARDYNLSFGYGGGLLNFDGTVNVRGSTFRGNVAHGGSNAQALFGRGHVGDGSGGGMINLDGANGTVTYSTFDHNEARGGDNNVGGTSLFGGVGAFIVGWGLGGAITNEGWNREKGTTLTVSNLTLMHNQALGGVGNSGNPLAGAGIGGGLVAWWIASTVTIQSSTFSHNKAAGNAGDNGQGGAVASVFGSVINVVGSGLSHNLALGGDNSDGAGGNGLGGGAYIDGFSTVRLQTTDVTGNHANAGEGSTSDGVGIGGGVYNLGHFEVDDPDRVRKNHASTSDKDIYTL